MLDYEALENLGREVGFTSVAPLDPTTIELKQEVRDMCAANTCGKYGKSWACPPACGELAECEARIRSFSEGILVQTMGQLEDEMDGEGMMETEAQHKKHFTDLYARLREQYDDELAIGAGACTVCKDCTYPDAPCRFPERRTSSMEAYGMLVLQVCRDNNVQYYFGPSTITYNSCFLLKSRV